MHDDWSGIREEVPSRSVIDYGMDVRLDELLALADSDRKIHFGLKTHERFMHSLLVSKQL